MIRLMIVAGDRSTALADFLSKGAFDVEYVYNSLSDGEESIRNSIIKVDKLVYVYQPESMSIREDMSLLMKMLSSDSFFTVSEILFIQKNGAYAQTAASYFSEVMHSYKSKKNQIAYSLKTVDDVLTFQLISDYIIGMTTEEDFKNSVTNIVRYEKNNESTKAYVKRDTRDYKVEPFNFIELSTYATMKDSLVKADQGYKIHEPEPEVPSVENPVFGSFNTVDLNSIKKFSIVSGKEKSGKSIWSCAFASSVLSMKHSILILDFTNNRDVVRKLSKESIMFHKATLEEIVKNSVPKDAFVSVYTSEDDDKWEMDYAILDILAAKVQDLEIDHVLVVCELDNLEEVFSLTKRHLNKLFICTIPVEEDYKGTERLVLKYEDDSRLYLLLNQSIKLSLGEEYLQPQEYRERINDRFRIVAPIDFKNFNVGINICQSILEA